MKYKFTQFLLFLDFPGLIVHNSAVYDIIEMYNFN